jgi:hypothetical protein
MNWDFSKIVDWRLVEICAEFEKKEKQIQQEKLQEQVIEELKQEKISEISKGKEEEQRQTIQELKEEIVVESVKETKEEIQSTNERQKIFDSKFAKEIVKSDEFKQRLIHWLKMKADENPRYSKYASIIRDMITSDITGEFRRRIKQYLYLRYILNGKQEVLKHIPTGVYPIVYKKAEKNKTETWIALSKGTEKEIKLYAVKVINLDEKIDAKFPSIFNVAFLVVNPNDVEYLEVDLDNNKDFPVYAKCDENCRWMPEEVLNIIKIVFMEIIEKKLYEEEKLKSQWTKEKEEKFMKETMKVLAGALKGQLPEKKQIQPKEEENQLENLFYKQVEQNLEIVFCKWNEYIQNAYLLPNVVYDEAFSNNYSYPYCVVNRFIWGDVLFIPKPVFLPKQIYIKDPDDIKQIPEGIYPIIRLYNFSQESKSTKQQVGKGLVFALSPNTEVVFEINYLTEDIFKDPSESKWFGVSNKGLDFAIVWNNNIMRRNILDFDKDVRKALSLDRIYKSSSSYWKISNKNGYMYYLPEPLFLLLMGENVKPKEEPFVAELILNSQINWKEWNNWVKSIANKYNNIKVDNENLSVIELTDLHKMYGAWYVKEIKRHFSKPYELDYYELVIINMREEGKIFKLKTNFDLDLREDDVGRVFITVWSDGAIGRWILKVEGY